MLTLTLLRHASALHGRPDHARALSTVGKAEARDIGQSLSDHISPTLITTSNATRTTTTAELVIKAAGWRITPQHEAMLYNAASWDVIALAATTPAEHDSILIIGHQPTMSQTVYQLTGKRLAIAPATGVLIDLDLESWSDLTATRGLVRTVLSANVGT